MSDDADRLREVADAARLEILNSLVLWVAERWEAEVKHRPIQNIHRRTLDGTWRQVLAKLDEMRGVTDDDVTPLPDDGQP